MIRAVLDANVFVSGILSSRGAPGRILLALLDEQFHLVTSDPILEEIGRVLRYPKISRRHGWSEEEMTRFIEDVLIDEALVGSLANGVRATPIANRRAG
jgi:putative PIN family toxin of toxin-antitoxin system